MPTKSIPCTCEGCGAAFTQFPSQIKKGRGRYCCRLCRDLAGRAPRHSRICQICGTEFHLTAAKLARGMGIYCGRTCQQRQWGSPEEHFWAKVHKTDTCWLWTGLVDEDGYGRFKRDGTDFRAHRFAYKLTYGTSPAGHYVCHHCDTPLCVRPDHLFLGTAADNLADCIRKGRRALKKSS